MTSALLIPPSLAELEALAQTALATIPDDIKRHLGPVVIRLEDFLDEETEEAMGLESPFDLLGLYRGVALPHKSVSSTSATIIMIFLSRPPILDYSSETHSHIDHVVRHVL